MIYSCEENRNNNAVVASKKNPKKQGEIYTAAIIHYHPSFPLRVFDTTNLHPPLHSVQFVAVTWPRVVNHGRITTPAHPPKRIAGRRKKVVPYKKVRVLRIEQYQYALATKPVADHSDDYKVVITGSK